MNRNEDRRTVPRRANDVPDSKEKCSEDSKGGMRGASLLGSATA